MFLLKRTALSSLIVWTTVAAQAQGVYRPIEYFEPALNERPDIKQTLQELPVPLRGSPYFSLESIDLSDVRLTFFSEIADLLTRSANPTYGSPQPPLSPSSCAAHEAFQIATVPAVNDHQRSCQTAYHQSVRLAFRDFKKNCRRLHEPESFVEDQKPGDVGFHQMSSLEGMMSLAGEALSHLDFPDNIVTPEFRQKMRVIVAKVRHDKLMGLVKLQDRSYAAASTLARSRPECFAATSEDLARFQTSIGQLRSEMGTARAFLERIDREGRAQAERDRRAVIAAGRSRNPLPYPSLTDEERRLLTLHLGGIYWRMRGGGLVDDPQGTQLTRFYFTFMGMSVLGYLNGGDVGRSAGQGLYYRLFAGWGRWMDMGRSYNPPEDVTDRYYDLVFMTKRGRYQVADARTVLRLNGYDDTAMELGGLQMGPCYVFSWDRLENHTIGASLSLPYREFLEGPTAWGEYCTGASLSLGLSRSLLNGRNR